MSDEEFYVSSEEHGFGAPAWMLRAALRGATHSNLLYGIDNMVVYLDAHARHMEDPDSDCEGPDLWTAFDILIQCAITGTYIPTTDPEDIPEEHRVKPTGYSQVDEEKLANEFKEVLGLLPETTDPEIRGFISGEETEDGHTE